MRLAVQIPGGSTAPECHTTTHAHFALQPDQWLAAKQLCVVHGHASSCSTTRGRGWQHLLSKRVVEGLKASMGVMLRAWVRQACTACLTLLASTLPSSTPHWSKLLMPHRNPCMHWLLLGAIFLLWGPCRVPVNKKDHVAHPMLWQARQQCKGACAMME